MGDVVIATWATTAIRMRYPEAHIVFAVDDIYADVLDRETLIDEIYPISRSRWKGTRWSPRTWREQIVAHLRLRRYHFDLALDLHGHSKTALLMRIANAKKMALANASDNFVRATRGFVPDRPPNVHNVDWSLHCLRTMGDFPTPELPIMPPVREERESFRKVLGRESRVATISVGAVQPANRYPDDGWRRVGELLLARGFHPVYIGAPNIVFQEPEGATNLIGKLPLQGSMAAIAESAVLISPDTGTGHLGAAYGVPVVSIFGPGNAAVFRPYTKKGIVLQHGGRTDNIEPEEVVQSALDLAAVYAA